MSDNVLRFVALDPDALPAATKTDAARELVAARFPEADRVEVSRFDGLRFIDNGANLEAVTCRSCGADLSSSGEWSRLMDAAWESGFADRRSVLSCCGASQSLEDLEYDWPIAFGRFAIDVWNPGVDWFAPGADSSAQEVGLISQLAGVLSTGVKAIWAHY